MSSKTETTTTNQYNAASMNTYNEFQPLVQNNLKQDAQTDVTKSKTYNLGLQNMTSQANAIGSRNVGNFMQNMKAGGYAGNNLSGVQQAGISGLGMGNSAMQANAFNQNFMNYDLMRRQATSMMQQYSPLQTGQNQTQVKSGVGTWLPQLVGAGMMAAGTAFSGGALGAAKAASMGAKVGMAGLSAGGSLANGFGQSMANSSAGGGGFMPSGSSYFGPGGGGYNPGSFTNFTSGYSAMNPTAFNPYNNPSSFSPGAGYSPFGNYGGGH